MTYWLNIATLANSKALITTIESLLRESARLEEISCAGTAAGLDSVRLGIGSDPAADDGTLALVRDVEPVMEVGDGIDVCATSGRRLAVLKGPDALSAPNPVSGPCWLDAADRRQLMERLLKGEIALVVEARDHEHWAASSRVLLQNSTSVVLGIVRRK